jgi:hypothetical protein
MSVEKFRSGEEMNAARPRTRTSDGFERFVRHCARFRRIAPRRYLPGVFRFRSIEEAQLARDRVNRAVLDARRTRVDDSTPGTRNS